MARRRRRRRFGYITLRSRAQKVARMHHRGGRSRVVGVKVFVQRGVRPSDTSDNPGYWAWACTSKHARSGERSDYSRLAAHRSKSCGPEEYGRTPTAALKKALVGLGRKKELR